MKFTNFIIKIFIPLILLFFGIVSMVYCSSYFDTDREIMGAGILFGVTFCISSGCLLHFYDSFLFWLHHCNDDKE